METIEVEKLNPAKIAKMRNKHAVRLAKGVGTKLKLGQKNAKKVLKALQKGKGVNVTLDENEIFENSDMNGGSLGKIGYKFYSTTYIGVEIMKKKNSCVHHH